MVDWTVKPTKHAKRMDKVLKHYIVVFMLLFMPFLCLSQDKDIVCCYNSQGISANGEYIVLCNIINNKYDRYDKYVPVQSKLVYHSYDDIADFKTPKIEFGYHIPSIKSYDMACGSLFISPNTLSYSTLLKTTNSKRYKF